MISDFNIFSTLKSLNFEIWLSTFSILKFLTSIFINDTAAVAAAYTGGSTLVVLYLLRALLSFANLLSGILHGN